MCHSLNFSFKSPGEEKTRWMSDSAPKSKKLKIEGFREYNFMTNNSINKRMANSFAEFLADPINILPRPEYLDCYIEVTRMIESYNLS